ncbi:MAG: ABC transporter permease [Armatimonadaceae bacterium]
MGAYTALFRARFRTLLQYRAAALAGFGTQLFWGLIRVMIMEAFYRQTTAAQPMTLPQVITYIWLGQTFFMLLPFSSNPDPEVRAMIRSGAVAYELARPLDLYWLWYSRALAARTAPTLLRVVPMFLVAVPFLGMGLPPNLAAFGAFALALMGAVLLTAAFSALITITLVWTVSGDGIARMAPSLVLLGSGMIVPLALLPEWAQAILYYLPFRGMVDAPFRLYMGHIPPTGVWEVVTHQAIWSVLIILAGHRMLFGGLRRLVVQGG